MVSQTDLGIAFAVTAGAGLSTGIGSAIVFAPRFYSPKILGVCLALAAGVMIYVSFVEIFFKGLDEMESYFDEVQGTNRSAVSAEDYEAPSEAYHAATATFFAGVAITWILDRIIHWLFSLRGAGSITDSAAAGFTIDLDTGEIQEHKLTDGPERAGPESCTDGEHRPEAVEDEGEGEGENDGPGAGKAAWMRGRGRELLGMALITGTAITLHNFPEGLATFVATARDASVGVPIALAIAVHNIPEGICVAVPIYYATNSKWRGFMWGTLSGVAEPLAGAVGWAILGSTQDEDKDVSSLVYALLFGLVAGMMVYISFRELLPTARQYDPQDRHVSTALFAGMAIIAASLMLFQI